MTDQQQLKTFVALVQEMRDRQRLFAKNRNGMTRDSALMSEQKVDNFIKNYTGGKKLSDPQKSMF